MNIQLRTIYMSFNYGANLQAIATLEILKNHGRVSLAMYQPIEVQREYSLIRKGSWKRIIADVLLINKRLSKKLYLKKLFKNFFQETLDQKTKIIVAGSDQIWNPKIFSNNSLDFFLPEVNDEQKCISISTSMGNPEKEYVDNSIFTQRLPKYQLVSVREKSLSDVLNLCGISSIHLNDPTSFLSPEEWREKFSNEKTGYLPTKKYILVYSIKKLEMLTESVNEYVQKIPDIEIVEITNSMSTIINGAKTQRHITLGHFIKLFDGAEAIITDSFHGTAFSVYFSKKFLTFSNRNSDARAHSFLAEFGLEDRLVYTSVDLNEKIKSQINYEIIQQKLHKLRQNALDRIKATFDDLK